ncbi:MAG: glycosyltransferase [Flavobacterium sp.]|nr:glycosyltransferase [Flavobacterium sp.]
MLPKKKILFVLPSLCAGGAERVFSFICQQFDANAFEVKLIVLGFEKEAVYNVDAVPVVYLNKSRLLLGIVALFRVIVKEKPAIVVSSIVHLNLLMGCFSLFLTTIKFIGREASVVSKMNEFSNFNSTLNTLLMKTFYPRLSAIICQSDDMRNDFIHTLKLNPSKLILIHNPITFLPTLDRKKNISSTFNFVTVGRLSPEKGYLRIIDGLSKIDQYDFHYTIIGSGPQDELIREKLENYKLTSKVTFIPFTSSVLEEVNRNDYFIQGSYVEGFPNALLESCIVGTPVIAFDAPGGTKDIVINGLNGFLVADEAEFASILTHIDQLKLINSDLVKQSVLTKFESDRIVKQYVALFNLLCSK